MSAASRSDLSRLRERVLFRLQRLMEFNADIDRNRSDSVFIQGGKEIKYVLDENIFEMFVRPYQYPNFAAAFLVSSRGTEADVSPEELAAAQSAMIGSEYLLSGRLPGQRDQRIYMTEWHFWELQGLMDRGRDEFHRAAHVRSEAFGAVQAPIEALREIRDETSLDRLLQFADAQVAEDVQELRAANWPDNALCRFVFTRQAARLLATNRMTEPVLQLDRIFSDEIAPRLRPLHLDFPVGRAEREDLQRDTKMWMGRLLEERARRTERRGGDESGERRYGTLQNDARSLAYILWAARSAAQGGVRMVFVTGDRLLFDAYRRWHVGLARSEPFVLRRPLQFAPFINFNDTPNDVEGARVLFDRTREAVEVPLIAFNMGLPPETSGEAPGDPPLQATAQREDLLLLMESDRPLDNPAIGFFMRRLTPEWLRNQEESGGVLRAEWLRMERVAIGANNQLVAHRFDRMQRTFSEVAAGSGSANIGDAVVSYVRRLLDRIVANSIRVWFPLAVEFIRTPSFSPRRGLQPRVPIALRLSLITPSATPSQPLEIDALLDSWAQGDEEAGRILDPRRNNLLTQRQHVVFAIAANLALRSSQWSQAQRYADLAGVAANLLPNLSEDEQQRADAAECDYLKALAIRFRIGSFSPYGTGVTEDVWGRWAANAVDILDRCEAYHHTPLGPRRHILRELRAVSERAALRLFYAGWVAAESREKLPPLVTPETAFRHLRAAFRDLRRCAEIHAEVEAGEPLDVQRSAFFDRLRRQYIPNSAAAEFIAYLFRVKYNLIVDETLVNAGGPISDWIEKWADPAAAEQLPIVVRIDIAAFLVVRRNDKQALEFLRGLATDTARQPSLPLDRALLSATIQTFRGAEPA